MTKGEKMREQAQERLRLARAAFLSDELALLNARDLGSPLARPRAKARASSRAYDEAIDACRAAHDTLEAESRGACR